MSTRPLASVMTGTVLLEYVFNIRTEVKGATAVVVEVTVVVDDVAVVVS